MITQSFTEAFVSHLPNPADIKIADETYWVQHGVNLAGIRENQHQKIWLQERLGRLDSPTLKALALWFNVSVETGQEREALARHFATQTTSQIIQIVLCLVEFIYNKHAKAVESISLGLLVPSVCVLLQNNVEPSSRRFAYALLVFFQQPKNLRFLILFDQAVRKNFGRYLLNGPGRAVDFSLHEAWINQEVLPDFGTKSRPIRCAGVYNQNQETVVFIWRALRDMIVPEVERYVFPKEAELIVLKFRDSGRSLDEHSQGRENKRPIGVFIAEAIMTKLSGVLCEYEVLSHETEEEKVGDLLECLLLGSDPQLYLRELYLSQAPMVNGNPSVILRCLKETAGGLSIPLKFLKEGKNLNFLEDPNLFQYLGVAFRPQPDLKLEPHIFDLYFTRTENGYRVQYSSKGGVSPELKRQFEIYMEKQREMLVTPIATGTPSPTIKAYHFEQILHEGIRLNFEDPNVRRTVETLKKKHIVDTQELIFIRCDWRDDPDFEKVTPSCDGCIELRDGQNLYECPRCHRVIEDAARKRRFTEVRISLNLRDIRQYLQKVFKKLEEAGHIEKVELHSGRWGTLSVTSNGNTFPVIIVGTNDHNCVPDCFVHLTFADPHLYVQASKQSFDATIVEKLRIVRLWDILAHEKNLSWLAEKLQAASYRLPERSTLLEVETKLTQAVAKFENAHGGPKPGKSWEAFEQWFMPLLFEYLRHNDAKVNQYLLFLRSLNGTLFGTWPVRMGGKGEPDWIAINRYEVMQQMLQVNTADAKFYNTTQISVDDVREVNGHLTRLHAGTGRALIMTTTDHISPSAWREVLDYKKANKDDWRVMILPKSWLLETMVQLDMLDMLDVSVN
ncbi:hypothetical protein DCC62_00535 [candidate division KSB1 bacterium]|nr:MAG: hypothetical protein DCC62_00535 [candidate division KSB1 bacterium]